ncbi:MAG: hypothetical protein GY722_03460 [bacterium]|nr:hypothetical protein [bacterium]
MTRYHLLALVLLSGCTANAPRLSQPVEPSAIKTGAPRSDQANAEVQQLLDLLQVHLGEQDAPTKDPLGLLKRAEELQAHELRPTLWQLAERWSQELHTTNRAWRALLALYRLGEVDARFKEHAERWETNGQLGALCVMVRSISLSADNEHLRAQIASRPKVSGTVRNLATRAAVPYVLAKVYALATTDEQRIAHLLEVIGKAYGRGPSHACSYSGVDSPECAWAGNTLRSVGGAAPRKAADLFAKLDQGSKFPELTPSDAARVSSQHKAFVLSLLSPDTRQIIGPVSNR